MKFKKIIKKFLKGISAKRNSSDIKKLISSLRPKRTNKKLIRLGGESDGGYLLPDDLIDLTACFSAGVGEISTFEYDCAKLGMEIFMADASVDAPTINDSRFNFKKKFIGDKDFADYITIEEWIKESKVDSTKDLLLQMDIEGAEFEVLNSVSSSTLKKFRILIIEFHQLQLLWDKDFYKKANSAFKNILKHHTCVHIHPNNCCGLRIINGIEIPVVAEFTFIRKDRIEIYGNATEFPHQLDRNNVENPELFLPPIWYENK